MSNAPKIDATLMKDQKPNGNGRKKAAGGILAKLGLGGGGAAGTAGGGGIVIGGGQTAASVGLAAALKTNAGILALTLLGATAAVTGALVFTGNAPKGVQDSKFFAKLGPDSATAEERAAARARDAELSTSGTDAGGVSSSLQSLVDANSGALANLDGNAEGEQKDAVATADASSEAPENTVQAPDNDWGAAAAAAKMPAGSKRPALQKRDFKKSGASASTKIAMAGPAAGATRSVRGAGANGATSGFSSSNGAASRSGSAVRGTKAISKGVGGGGASAQLKAHSGTLRSNLSSGRTSSAGSGAVMDGAAGRIGSQGAGASQIAGGGGAGSAGGDSSPIVNPVTSQNTSSKNPPPPIEKAKDKTPYKKEMKMATMALLAATALLLLASLVSNAEFPQAKAIAKILAGLAIAAAAVATVMGVILMTKHNQMLQGGMFAVGGAIIMFQATMVLTKKDAGAEGQAAVDQQKLQAQDEAFRRLHPDATSVDVANGAGGRYYQVGDTAYQVGPNGASEGFLSAGPKGDPAAYWSATKPEVPWKPPPPLAK